MRTVLQVAALMSVVLGLAYDVRASEWDGIGGGCVPTSPNSTNIETYFGAVRFKSGGTGEQFTALYCPITPPSGFSPTTLYMLYLDATATDGSNNHVIVAYQKMAKATGVTTVIAQMDSQTSAGCGTTTTPKGCAVAFTDTFDFTQYYYFVEVNMYQEAALTYNEVFYGATVY
jgi:hypothetical protein